MKTCLTLLSILITSSIFAQDWQFIEDQRILRNGERQFFPDKYKVAILDEKAMKTKLWSAPHEKSENQRDSRLVISVPLANGEFDDFSIKEYSMMEPALQAKFRDFKTFIGQSLSNPFRRIRIDFTNKGFRALISDLEGQIYIDPYQTGENQSRIIYNKKDYTAKEDWTCEVKEVVKAPEVKDFSNRFAGDCQLREYQLACAATGEYTAFHGGTVAGGQAAIVTSINRVNEIFETDLSVRFILVANNNLLVFTDGANDPYNNGSGGAMLGQNQTTVDDIIGFENYDIGHVFSTGGGGVAYLRSLCNQSQESNSITKAGGVTGQGQPIGDPFDIDFVAHEIGHQFGGNHTQNNSCQRNSTTSVEPGSASSIMGYAGICPPNVQNNSDAHFHAISIAEMTAHITGAANSCAEITAPANNQPVLEALQNYTVPKSTYLVLDATANDADGNDNLSYCWEQMDNAVAPMPPDSNSTVGPLFRSLPPQASSSRYLPDLDTILSGEESVWEVLPSVSRSMNWRVTVRDRFESLGCTDEQDMVVTVDGGSGPFKVINASVPQSVSEGQSLTLQWDVAGTDVAPVNCPNVDILLSTDGGLTYPINVVSGTDNDGSEAIIIPSGTTTTARLMVRCSDNIFFDINNEDFEIEEGLEGFTIEVDPLSGGICNNESIQFSINSFSIAGFSDNITLGVTGIPSGANVAFSQNPITPGSSSVVTLSNFGSNTGTFTLDVVGTSGTLVRTKNYDLTLFEPTVAPGLNIPLNNAVDVSVPTTLSWSATVNASSYSYEVSSSPGGGGNVASGATSELSVSIATLGSAETYFWRVRAENDCGASAWSLERQFTTSECLQLSAVDLPMNITDGLTINSIINVAQMGQVTEVSLVDVEIDHSYFWDLNATLIGPDNTAVNLFAQECNQSSGLYTFSLSDNGVVDWPCPPNGVSIQPTSALNLFNGKEMNGDWVFRVRDGFRGDFGTIDTWSLKICYESDCDLNVDSGNATGLGSLLDAIECASPGDVITLSSSLANQTIALGNETIDLMKNLTITADPTDNISISYSGSGNAMRIFNNASITLEGITIVQN